MVPDYQRNASFRLGMVVALPAEAQAMLGRRSWTRLGDLAVCTARGPAGIETLWVRCGVGCERSAKAAAYLIEQGVTHLGIAGVSGGLAPELVSGDLVLASEVVDAGGQCWKADSVWQTALIGTLGDQFHTGRILTTAGALLAVEQKAFWYERSGALAVDMESAAVARLAAAAGKPFFVLRAVCDSAARTVPELLFALVDDFGRPRVGKLMATLVRHPFCVPALLNMQKDFGRALRGLARGWQALCALHAIGSD